MQRKTVTVLFCDITGSTALGESVDPEALRGMLARYFERMKTIVENHGGTIEKFIGDAVMAVYGVPVAHEDDALRAVRASAEMIAALPELGVEARIGINTGEVVTGTEERLVTGDAVNVAARLEQAAQRGEVLIGEPTLALVRDAVEAEPVGPLALKGKAAVVTAHRLVSVRDAPDWRQGAPFVGRKPELSLLHEVWGRTRRERRCELVTIVGDAGVGKSRLVAEFLGELEATVVRGRALPYGEGITYWPVVEVLKQLHIRPPEKAAAAIRALLGETEAVPSAEEIAWAFRKTLEHAAAERPVVVVFDDIQWAEETFLDLIEHVALLSSEAAILGLCMARPELAERRSTWPVTLRLKPLAEKEVDALIPRRIAGRLREKIARSAGGNPLFIQEMVAMAGEADGEAIVPPNLQALLTARLDQLEPRERLVLECGAVEGEIFHRSAVQALAPTQAQVTPQLAALVRKELIRPDTPQFLGEDGFRFSHLLIRDAAYDGVPKATRAELHERCAAWLDTHAKFVAHDEIVGYHLEQAARYCQDLGSPEPRLAESAGARLGAAARSALARGDWTASRALSRRVLDLVPEEHPLRLEVLPTYVFASWDVERGRRAQGPLDELLRSQDERAVAYGTMLAAMRQIFLGYGGSADELEQASEYAAVIFERVGDESGLASAYLFIGLSKMVRGRMADTIVACERAAGHARRANAGDAENECEVLLAAARLFGPTPVPDAIAYSERRLRDFSKHPRVGGELWKVLGLLYAMRGEIEKGRDFVRAARELERETGFGEAGVAVSHAAESRLEWYAGELDKATALAHLALANLEEVEDRESAGRVALYLTTYLEEAGKLDEAESVLPRARQVASPAEVFEAVGLDAIEARLLCAARTTRRGRAACPWGSRSGRLDRSLSRTRHCRFVASAGARVGGFDGRSEGGVRIRIARGRGQGRHCVRRSAPRAIGRTRGACEAVSGPGARPAAQEARPPGLGTT